MSENDTDGNMPAFELDNPMHAAVTTGLTALERGELVRETVSSRRRFVQQATLVAAGAMAGTAARAAVTKSKKKHH